MRNARVALFLVSDHLLGSEFVTQNEMPELLRMAEERGLRVVWVLLRPCFREECGLRSYQGANAKRPLSGLKAAERDKIIHAACKTVLEVAG